jgi:protein-S-isoprenylcysteine O-methyltransferase Ste14
MDNTDHICIVICLAGIVIRDGYEVLKLRGRIDPLNKAVFAVVFTAMCAMWVSWFGIGLLSPSHLAIAPVVRWTGLVAVIVGLALALGGVWQLRGVENIDHLVTTGLYARIRHPMYLGFTLWILGWVAYEGAPANLAVGVLALASVLWWRQLEERDLTSAYGDAYTRYRATTWF